MGSKNGNKQMNYNTAKYLTVAQAAVLSGYSEWQIRKFCRQGLLVSTRRAAVSGGRNAHIRITVEELHRFVTARPVAG